MKTKIFLFSLIFLSIFFVHQAKASVEITEIMYDAQGADTDREWIEVKNTGASAVDLSTYKLFEANTNHSLVVFQGETNLQSGAFAIIADKPANFLSDNSGFTGVIFDSSFSLSNSGESLEIKDGSGVSVDSIIYDPTIGAQGDGKTLQKINGVWQGASSTPGQDSSSNTSQTAEQTNNNQNNQSTTQVAYTQTITSTHFVSEDVSTEPVAEEKSLSVSAGRNRLVTAGSPIEFRAKISSDSNKQTIYEWSLGDGFIAYGEVVEHIYAFAGDYVVVLTVKNKNKSAVSRINVRVIEPTLSAVHVLGGIKIKNSGKDEINLYKWLISSGGISYTFPMDLIIMPGKTITVDSRISHLPEDGPISLVDTMGRSVALNQLAEPSKTIKVSNLPLVDNPVSQNRNVASANKATDNVLVIEHKNGLFKSIGVFFKNIFSRK